MVNPGPRPSASRLREVPVRRPDPASQPPYYLNGYEHEEAPAAEPPTRPLRRPHYPPATGTRTLWMLALAFAVLLTVILTVR
jgi:hypothetical protein